MIYHFHTMTSSEDLIENHGQENRNTLVFKTTLA